jgi:membrane protein involved in colicin uptake
MGLFVVFWPTTLSLHNIQSYDLLYVHVLQGRSMDAGRFAGAKCRLHLQLAETADGL